MLSLIRGAAPVAAAIACTLMISPSPAQAGPGAPCPIAPPGPPASFVQCFDTELSGSAASAASFEALAVNDALILSETDASFLLGLSTAGWATSGEQGLLNSLAPAIEFQFDAGITAFQIDVVGLAGPFGEAVPVVIAGFLGDSLVAVDVSDITGVGTGETHTDTLSLLLGGDRLSRVLLFSAEAPCSGLDCTVGATTSLFADTLQYTVPEPGAALLAGLGFAFLGLSLRPRSHGMKGQSR